MSLNVLVKCPKVDKPTRAVWHLRSKLDKRWNEEGPFIYKGMKGIPLECSYRIEELKLKYNDPPEDLEWGFTLTEGINSGWYVWVSFKWWLKGVLDWIQGPEEKQ